MMNRFFLERKLFIFAIFLMLAGCASTAPTRYYNLNSLISSGTEMKAVSTDQNIAIGVGPIEIPDYLDRPHIVTRTGRNEIKIDDFNKWAGSLRNDISRVLSENLSVLLSIRRVYDYPFKSYIPLEYQIVVNITRFDGMPGGKVMLKADWTILGGKEKKVILMDAVSFSEQTEGGDYDSLIAAKSRILANLSRDITAALKASIEERRR
jgi:uncharacterized lipoprotein YmbA